MTLSVLDYALDEGSIVFLSGENILADHRHEWYEIELISN